MAAAVDDRYVELLSAVHALCRRARCPYAIMGGLGLVAYGSQRPTADLDIAVGVKPRDVDAFLGRAERAGFRLDPPALRDRFKQQMVRLWWGGERAIKVDAQLAALPHIELALGRRRRKRIARRAFWFTAPEDLIVLKLIAGREHDLTDVAFLLALPARELDRGYLRRVVRRWRLLPELAEAERRTRHPPP